MSFADSAVVSFKTIKIRPQDILFHYDEFSAIAPASEHRILLVPRSMPPLSKSSSKHLSIRPTVSGPRKLSSNVLRRRMIFVQGSCHPHSKAPRTSVSLSWLHAFNENEINQHSIHNARNSYICAPNLLAWLDSWLRIHFQLH